MIIHSLSINENLQEQVPRNTEEFPLLACYGEPDKYPGGHIAWHWHPDVEFTWILQGGIRLCTNNHTFLIQTGEGAFINSNMLHYKEPVPGPPPITLDLVFDSSLISGFHRSVFDQKYITPILECRELEAIHLHPSVPNHRTILELIRHSYDAIDRAEAGYEFTVRNDMSSAWFLLFQEAAPILNSRKVVASQSEERIKQMMIFIHAHFSEKISLEQIASSASISEREALRCFNQNLNTTPFTYLLEYRTRRAASELLETNHSITDIAYSCGFSGTSYFSKTFKKIMHCTPSEYRELHKKDETISDIS